MANERSITTAQYAQLEADISSNNRVQYYLHLFEYTGSFVALYMSQISSASEVPGGVAYNVNKTIETLFPEDYPAGGINQFSKEIANADFDLILANPENPGFYTAPNELEMLESARSEWDRNNLGRWFPGNGLLAAARLLDGDPVGAATAQTEFNLMMVATGIVPVATLVEVAGEFVDSRINFGNSLAEKIEETPNAGVLTQEVRGITVTQVIDANGITVGSFVDDFPAVFNFFYESGDAEGSYTNTSLGLHMTWDGNGSTWKFPDGSGGTISVQQGYRGYGMWARHDASGEPIEVHMIDPQSGAYMNGAAVDGRITWRMIDPDTGMEIVDNGQSTIPAAPTLNDEGRIVLTAERRIDDHLIEVEFVEDEWGAFKASRVLFVDGQPAESPTAFATVLNNQGCDAWEFADSGAEDIDAALLDEIYQNFDPMQISGMDTLLNGANNFVYGYGSAILDGLRLIQAIQNGEPLPILASGLQLAATFDRLDGGGINYNLSGAANVASGILSLMSLDAALERGDALGAVTAGAQAVSYGAQAYANLATANNIIEGVSVANDISGFLNGGNGAVGVIPVLSLINSIVQGDVAGIAVATLNIMVNTGIIAAGTALAAAVPVIGWIYAVYSILDSLFSSEEIPDPWGTGQFLWNGTGITYQTAGETGGAEAVTNVMTSVLATLNSLIERERLQNPGSQLGIIPGRMPSMGYDMSGYRYTDIDPLTGAEKHPALRFDTSGNPYNAEPGSPESFQSIVEGMVYSALGRQAIAPLWEVLTARAQTDAGDPKAGLTEEERAGRDGQLAPPITGTTQTFRPVMLDLDGDGIETLGKAASGVAFDVDDSGFMKQTGWATGGDAFLTLDRDYNGETNSGREMFSNSVIDINRRGLAGMRWVDSNYDGKLTAADPVWNELKVWLDDGDGVDEAGEKPTLAGLGITELNYSMGTFTQNGQVKQLASPDLDADKDGTRISIVPEGILVQNSADNKISLLVTRIDDLTLLEANRDGVTSYEDIETIISSGDLLANDTLGGFSGSNLAITVLFNLCHWMNLGYLTDAPLINTANDDSWWIAA